MEENAQKPSPVDRLLMLIDRLAGLWLDWRTDQAAKSNPAIKEFDLHKVEAGGNGWEITAFAPGVAILADQAADLLNQMDAKNYVQFDMMPRLDRGKPAVRVTVQWAAGIAPATLAAQMKQRADVAEARVKELESACEYALSCLASHQVYDKDMGSILRQALDAKQA